MIGFLIWKGLVILSKTGINGPINGKRIIGLADIERLAHTKKLTNIEKSIPIDTKKPVIICYKHQYYYKCVLSARNKF